MKLAPTTLKTVSFPTFVVNTAIVYERVFYVTPLQALWTVRAMLVSAAEEIPSIGQQLSNYSDAIRGWGV